MQQHAHAAVGCKHHYGSTCTMLAHELAPHKHSAVRSSQSSWYYEHICQCVVAAAAKVPQLQILIAPRQRIELTARKLQRESAQLSDCVFSANVNSEWVDARIGAQERLPGAELAATQQAQSHSRH